jgi:hypothetical protein
MLRHKYPLLNIFNWIYFVRYLHVLLLLLPVVTEAYYWRYASGVHLPSRSLSVTSPRNKGGRIVNYTTRKVNPTTPGTFPSSHQHRFKTHWMFIRHQFSNLGRVLYRLGRGREVSDALDRLPLLVSRFEPRSCRAQDDAELSVTADFSYQAASSWTFLHMHGPMNRTGCHATVYQLCKLWWMGRIDSRPVAGIRRNSLNSLTCLQVTSGAIELHLH